MGAARLSQGVILKRFVQDYHCLTIIGGGAHLDLMIAKALSNWGSLTQRP